MFTKCGKLLVFISSNIVPVPRTPVCSGGTPGTQIFGHLKLSQGSLTLYSFFPSVSFFSMFHLG